MEFELKNYKFFKIKQYLKKSNFFFFFNGTNLNLKNWILIEQTFKKLKLKFYRMYNTLIIKAIKNSIYENITSLINGLIIFVKPDPKTLLKLKTLLNIDFLLTLLTIKLNKQFYSVSQLKNILFFNFNKNIKILYKSLKTYLKIPYYKLTKS